MAGKWIGLEDAKPHQFQDVYVCRTGVPRCAFPAHYRHGKFLVFDMYFDVCEFVEATHWMPIEVPELPK